VLKRGRPTRDESSASAQNLEVFLKCSFCLMLQAPELSVASKWAGAASESGIGCLLVAWNKADLSASDPASSTHSEAMLGWCLDNGFEHVECVATRPHEGNEGREKNSVGRVLEALQSTMWSNMVRGAPTTSTASSASSGSSSADTGAGAAAGAGSAASSALESAAEKDDSYGLLNPDAIDSALLEMEEQQAKKGVLGGGADDDGAFAGESDDAARALMAALAGSSEAEKKEGSSEAGKADAGSKKKDTAASKKSSASVLEDFDRDFTRVIEEAKAVRDNAKKGNMTDAQRREAAANATMRLMAMFSSMGLDMGEDEDEEEASGAGGAGAKGGK
jgi:Alpha and gamma adaptin binding protein p34